MGSESVIEALQCESTRGMEQKEATISRQRYRSGTGS
jgi:hypothetical protein